MSITAGNRAPRLSFAEYGISVVRYEELRDGCKAGKYGITVLRQACIIGIPEEIRAFVIKSVVENQSYDDLEFDLKLGRIPCGRTNFYGYRRAFYHNLDCLLRDQEERLSVREGDIPE